MRILDKVDPEVGRTILTNDVEAKFEGISMVSPAIRPDQVVPMRNFAAWYSAYGKWYADGRSTANGGVEPTGDVLALIDAYDAIKVAAGPNRDAIVAENVAKSMSSTTRTSGSSVFWHHRLGTGLSTIML